MKEKEARAIESQLTALFPGCKIEAYPTAEANYETKQFVVTWNVAAYADGTLVCILHNEEHSNALLSMCSSYYNLRKEIEEDAYPDRKSFVDQTGQVVIQGGVYGIDEHGDLYDLEPVEHIKPSEY